MQNARIPSLLPSRSVVLLSGLLFSLDSCQHCLISVRRNVTFPSNQPVITTPKTQHGVRQIPLDKTLIALLDKADDDIGFVIGSEIPITLTSYRNTYARIQKRVNLQGATAHVFRHSYLTLLDETGVGAKTLQSIAGHGDINTTWNRYVHGRVKAIMNAGDKFAALVNTSKVFQTLSEKAKSIASTTSTQDDLLNLLEQSAEIMRVLSLSFRPGLRRCRLDVAMLRLRLGFLP